MHGILQKVEEKPMYDHFYITSITSDTLYGIEYKKDGSKNESWSIQKIIAGLTAATGVMLCPGNMKKYRRCYRK